MTRFYTAGLCESGNSQPGAELGSDWLGALPRIHRPSTDRDEMQPDA